jgi:glycosyltransferase involved in cell wall biosynthesis
MTSPLRMAHLTPVLRSGVTADPARSPPVRALITMPSGPVGVGMTFRNVVGSAAAAGYAADIFTTRLDSAGLPPAAPVHESIRPWLRRLPYGLVAPAAERRLHRDYLAAIRPGEVAYLWPSVPLALFQTLKSRGNRIVGESVNTRMAVARPILDAAYDALGLPAAHGITDARIADQAARHALCDVICAPSPATEAALAAAGLSARIVPTSYGTWLPTMRTPRPPRARGEPVTFLFVGLQCVRKGIHVLLHAWRNAPANARLRLVGDIEPAIARLYADVLNLPSVSRTGFTLDVAAEYRAADVFVLPSLEEGDAIVTYEAAAHALPLIATHAGAGRFGADTGAVSIVPGGDASALADRIATFAASDDLRRDAGAQSRKAVAPYDWSAVGPRSFAALHAALGH